MKKIVLLTLFPIIFLSAYIEIAAQQTNSSVADGNWIGEYRYSFSERGNSSYTDVTEYILTISNSGDGSGCHFVVQGPQFNNADYECRAETKGDKLIFYFVKSLEPMGDGQVDQMKSGYVIGSLIRATTRGKIRYRLEGGRYEFVVTSTAARPVYFKKISRN